MRLDGFDVSAFLRDYWQKRPLLIRGAFAEWENPLEPDELAGLACEEGVEARLIVHGEGGLTLENGPLPETRFADLDGRVWTLLVQAVDHHVPDVAALIEPFRFVPDWRIDDVMVSYAVDGGGVGPHFDQYDVFLIQGLGRRRWRVGAVCDAATPLVEGAELRLLAEFAATDEYVLEPGDMLYVPPGFAHDGVAVSDDCMTYSVGFRAPSAAELVEGWAEQVADNLPEDLRYTDPDLAAQSNPGEIAPDALDRAHRQVLDALADRAAFARWFGAHSSLPKYPEVDWSPEAPVSPEDVHGALDDGAVLCRNPASRFAFVRQGAGVVLFVDGQAFDCAGDTATLAEAICAGGEVAAPSPSPAAVALLTALINRGSLALEC